MIVKTVSRIAPTAAAVLALLAVAVHPGRGAVAGSLRVAVCQMPAEDGQIDGNLARAERLVKKAKADGAQLCVFPELMDVGFDKIVKGTSDVPLAFPIPGKTAARLGAMAKKHGVWISAALLEGVEGGSYDTNVLIDERGVVVHKQRKVFCYPSFAGKTCFQGNFHDLRAVDSPWGPICVMNCADTDSPGKRKSIARQRPALVLVNFANPQANLVPNCNKLAVACRVPVVGCNMTFAAGPGELGGGSRIVAADGTTLWQARHAETVETLDLLLSQPAAAAAAPQRPAHVGGDGLVGWWTFDKTPNDRSGKGNDAVLRGGAAYSSDAAPTGGRNTHSLSLGQGGYALVSHAASLDAPQAATVAMWVKFRSAPAMFPQQHGGWVGLLSKGGWWQENYAVGLGDYFYLFGRGFGSICCPAIDNVVRNSPQWHHVVTVVDAEQGEARLYIDGVLNHRVLTMPGSTTNTHPLFIGRFSHESKNSLDGLLDDVRVYTRALGDEEIAALVPGAKVNQPPLVEAGDDLRTSIANQVTLKGSCRDDAAFASSRSAGWTAWRRLSGPGRVLFERPFAVETSATFTECGEYVLELIGSDGSFRVRDTLRVRVE